MTSKQIPTCISPSIGQLDNYLRLLLEKHILVTNSRVSVQKGSQWYKGSSLFLSHQRANRCSSLPDSSIFKDGRRRSRKCDKPLTFCKQDRYLLNSKNIRSIVLHLSFSHYIELQSALK